jgi:2-polyprenyl-6-methoxyphenol hydroxylase-like FAD-dependent oxidoreductase
MQHPPSSCDVVIAGAGPVGLFLACELALAGSSVLVLERESDPHAGFKQLPFGMRGLSVPSVEALYRRGLLDQLDVPKRMQNAFGAASERPGGHFAGIVFHAAADDPGRWPWRLPGAPAGMLMAEMAELEAVLARRAEALGVRIRRGAGVSGFVQDDEGVDVQLGAESVRAQWLVGCDGARSALRKAGGFDFAGTEPEFTGYSVHLELADPTLLGAGRQLTPRGMVAQFQPGYLAIQEFDGGAGHDGAPLTCEPVEAVLRRVSGLDLRISKLHAASTWTDRARQATRYRHGRVLLAGDAAHIHAPLGGQGLNLGIGDAMNLGWKLAATVRGTAPHKLLDTYEAERHPVGARVLDWSRAQVLLMRPDPAARALREVVAGLTATEDGAACMAGRLWGIETRYELGGGHPLSGRSAPDFAFDDGTRFGEHMRDGRAILLDFSANAALQRLAEAGGAGLRYLAAAAQDRLGVAALLVRPDGIVAWASCADPDIVEAAGAAAASFLRFPDL